LGTPLRVSQSDWREYGRRAETLDGAATELEVRFMILAEEMGIIIGTDYWRERTAMRVMARLVTGNGGQTRRFPNWFFGDGHTASPRPFPDNGPLRVLRRSNNTGFPPAVLDEAEVLLAAARSARTNLTASLLPLAERLGARREAQALARRLIRAVRDRYRRR
jgi:hypothetical protein